MSDYTLLSFNEVLELDCYTYKLLLKDSFIHTMKQTDEGKEYLEDAYNLTQTSPDREKLREVLGRQ